MGITLTTEDLEEREAWFMVEDSKGDVLFIFREGSRFMR